MSTPLEQALALLQGAQLTEDEAARLAAAAQATVQPSVPVLEPGLIYTDCNDDLWQAGPAGVPKRLTLTGPFQRGTGDRDPYLGGPAPADYCIADPSSAAEVAPLTPLGALPSASPAQQPPATDPTLTEAP